MVLWTGLYATENSVSLVLFKVKSVPWLFRKDIPFKVVKNEEKPKEEAKADSEPKKEPEPSP